MEWDVFRRGCHWAPKRVLSIRRKYQWRLARLGKSVDLSIFIVFLTVEKEKLSLARGSGYV